MQGRDERDQDPEPVDRSNERPKLMDESTITRVSVYPIIAGLTGSPSWESVPTTCFRSWTKTTYLPTRIPPAAINPVEAPLERRVAPVAEIGGERDLGEEKCGHDPFPGSIGEAVPVPVQSARVESNPERGGTRDDEIELEQRRHGPTKSAAWPAALRTRGPIEC
jgi:hypothetical protein